MKARTRQVEQEDPIYATGQPASKSADGEVYLDHLTVVPQIVESRKAWFLLSPFIEASTTLAQVHTLIESAPLAVRLDSPARWPIVPRLHALLAVNQRPRFWVFGCLGWKRWLRRLASEARSKCQTVFERGWGSRTQSFSIRGGLVVGSG